VHKLSLKGSAKLVAEFVSSRNQETGQEFETLSLTDFVDNVSIIQFQYSIHTILYVDPHTCIGL
jgi:hypothetical protein